MAHFKTLSRGMALQEMQGFRHAILIMDTFSFPPQLQLRILVYLVFLTNNIPSYAPHSNVFQCALMRNSLTATDRHYVVSKT